MLLARVRSTATLRAIAQRQLHSTPQWRAEDVLERLRKNFEDKKQEHVEAAKRDGASILSVTGQASDLEQSLTHKCGLVNYNEAHKTKAIYGFGYTRPDEVFVNNDLDLSNIEVYGFDYDYTLANYTNNLSKAIYDILRDILVDMLRYPKPIKDLQFDPAFAIRGLHYDFNKGWLMKIDSIANIQLNTVHVGRDLIDDPEQVIRHYNGTHIGPDYLNENMFQLNDLFSIPQACLLSDVLQYFKDNDINFHPRYLCDDVSQAARILHTGSSMGATHHHIGGRLHMAVVRDIPQFLEKSPKLVAFLEKLRNNGKKTFLLSNSSLPFIDKGMRYLTSRKDWRDLFDCVIVLARKPEFYRSRRPFRRTREPTWSSVNKFEPGEVYQGGNLYDFSRLTGWSGQKVLYFGDHIYSDLIDPTIQQGWRTGAIIHELAAEIETRNMLSYRHTLAWLLRIERLLINAQNQSHVPGLENLVDEWTEERKRARHELKDVFNKSFGSLFRTYNNPTFFANKIRKFADIYMSNITNLDHISLDYRFYPERTYLPHERLVETLIDTGRIENLLH